MSFFCFTGYSQLDHTHYFPPIKQEAAGAIEQQVFYISTPETVPFDVQIFIGTSTSPIVLSGLSNTNPLTYTVADGTNDVTLVSEINTGVVIGSSGLRFVAANGEKFYVNYRCKSQPQAGSLTCKGRRALGTDFRWGGIPSVTSTTYLDLNNVLGLMASEDNTIVTISGYNTNVVFRKGSVDAGINDDTITINLNANESFVLEVLPRINVSNFEGWLGATITATKPIVVNSSGLVGLYDNTRDLAMDQIVPVDVIGQQYGFIRGNGADESEFPLIVATKDNTDVFVNGIFYGNIDNGEFLKVSGSLYSSSFAGGNLFVEANKKVYAYQCLTGKENDIRTIGMNFIPPLSCLLPTSFDHISDISDIAGSSTSFAAVTVIASSDTPNEEIKVYQNNVEISKPSPTYFRGSSEWKSFLIENLSGSIKVISTGNVAVGFFVNDGATAGYAGYFSGFDTVPETEILLITEGGCLPGGKISIQDPTLQYQWYKDGVAISGATSNELELIGLGAYYADIITDSGCLYKSETYDAKYCYDIAINKSADKSNMLEGDQITYTIEVDNKGSLPVHNMVIAENFPTELQMDSQSVTHGVWNVSNWEIPILESGTTAILTIQGSLASNETFPEVTNTLTVNYDEIDLNHNLIPDDLTETIEVLNGEVKITAISAELENPYRIVQGDVLNFTYAVSNHGDIPFSKIQLNTYFTDSDIFGRNISGDVNNNRILDLNETWIYTAPYNITQSQINALEVVSTTEVLATQANAFVQRNEVAYTFAIDPEFVVPYIDLAITLEGNGPNIYVDDNVDIQLHLTSDHVSEVTNLEISSSLPSGLEFLSYSSEIGVYDEFEGTWKIDNLEKNADTYLKIKAKMLAQGEHVVNAEISSFTQLDSITNNNQASLQFKPICYRVFNEFSPNDDGINDYLVMQCLELTGNVVLQVFNRVGVLVYRSNNYNNDFNGFGNQGIYMNSNKMLPNGTYYYVINLDNGTEERKGWLYINR